MKKIILIIWAMALMLLVNACGGLDPAPVVDPDPVSDVHIETVRVSYEDNGTKVTVARTSGTLAWSATDVLAVYRSVSGFQLCPLESGVSGGYTVDVTLAGDEVRSGYAVYPGSVATKYQDGKIMLTLPDSYDISGSLADTEDASYAPIPLIAANASGSDLVFYQVGGLMRLIVSDIPAGTTTLMVDFGKRITGKFVMNTPTPGTSAIATDDELTETRVNFTVSAGGLASETDNVVLNVPVPTGTYTDLLVVARDAAGTALASWVDHAHTRSFSRRSGIRKVILLAPLSTTANGPTCVSPGDGFEVGSSKYYMAPGNLANTSYLSGSWYFLGGDSGKQQLSSLLNTHTESPGAGKACDSFTWPQMYELFMQQSYASTAADAGYQISSSKTLTVDGVEWRMPNNEEWHHFIGSNYAEIDPVSPPTRTKRATVGTRTDAMYAKVRVLVSGSPYSTAALADANGLGIFNASHGELIYVPGLMLFPDGYADYTGSIEAAHVNDSKLKWADTPIIPYENFAQMAEAGVLFLPAAGYKIASGWDNVGNVGYYWSATGINNIKAYRMAFFFSRSLIRIAEGSSSDFNRSVRLIRRVDGAGLQTYGIEEF